jgi:hypothetical protein
MLRELAGSLSISCFLSWQSWLFSSVIWLASNLRRVSSPALSPNLLVHEILEGFPGAGPRPPDCIPVPIRTNSGARRSCWPFAASKDGAGAPPACNQPSSMLIYVAGLGQTRHGTQAARGSLCLLRAVPAGPERKRQSNPAAPGKETLRKSDFDDTKAQSSCIQLDDW